MKAEVWVPASPDTGARASPFVTRRRGVPMVFAEWQVGQVFWSMLWFTMFFLWIWVLIRIFGDIFRSRDLGGWGKALWTLFVIFLPFLGVLAYLIVRGHKLGEHELEEAQRRDMAMRAYVRGAVETNPADDLARLVDLHDRGVITEAEFEAMRQKVAPS